MTGRMSLSRRRFLKSGLVVAGYGLWGIHSGRAGADGKKDRPNILWLTSEDNSIFWVSCYDGTNCQTPNIDKLAEEGFRYIHCFDNAAVCAPTRSTWITGMYAISNGTQPMRSRNDIPHDVIKYYPDLLRKAGYHTSNWIKTDYNIGGRPDRDCWDVMDRKIRFGWRKRKPGQPFFAVVNSTSSHESRAHGDVENTRNDPDKMTLHAYHPDLPVIRKNYAKYADAVENMDNDIRQTLDALKEDGLFEDTIIIYCSDHGGVMPRSKRFLYSSGTHCPLVVRIPEKYKHLWPAEKPGMTVDRIVSFVDMPKTWLSLAGARIPDTFQGTVFLGEGIEPEPKYHLSFRERADERCDCVRMIRDKQFAYYKNYMPYAPAGQYLEYLWRAPATPAWEKYHKEGKTDEITGRFFRPRVSEEFYDTVKDFDNVHNLIDDPKHRKRIARMKRAMREKQLELYDSGLLPESMRERRARQHNTTIYEMVRNPKLYPLESYLDAADRALERNANNLSAFIKGMSDSDSGIRYWAVVGLHLLKDKAEPSVEVLKNTLRDDSDEVKIMAAWTLVNLGRKEIGLECLSHLLNEGTTAERKLLNVLDWMGVDAVPLVREYLQSNPNKAKNILAKIAQDHGIEVPK
ncbi:MAG: sulfatase-like hydrolase/transferase [Sedimentisphaerales bacterium]|nr:sulfatase-like hydrolase/transferase [Sedimentisphaerales bacterium]